MPRLTVQKRRARLSRIAFVLLVMLFEGCRSSPIAPTPVPPVAPAMPPPVTSRSRFLAFGDSLTAGTASPALTLRSMTAGLPESYPFKFQQLMTARYRGQAIEVENAGKPAEMAADGMLRLPGVLRAFSPEVVVLLHGINDLPFAGRGGVTRVAQYVNTMARDARLAGADVVVCTLPPNRTGGFRAGDPVVLAAYNTALRDVARGEGALLVDFERDVDLGLIGQDGAHPTEAGYARMADVLFEAIRRRYESSGARTMPAMPGG